MLCAICGEEVKINRYVVIGPGGETLGVLDLPSFPDRLERVRILAAYPMGSQICYGEPYVRLPDGRLAHARCLRGGG